MNEKTIGLFTPTLEMGGVEQVRIHLAREFLDRGYRVDLVVGQKRGILVDSVPESANIVNLNAQLTRFGILGIIPGLTKYFKTNSPDIFMSGMNHVNLPAIISWKLSFAPTKLIVSEHNPPDELRSIKNRIVSMLVRSLYPLVPEIVAVSTGVARSMSQEYDLPQEQINIIYNPVDIDEIQDLADEDIAHPWFQNCESPIIIGAGRFHPQKNFQSLLRAFSIIRSEKDAKLVILGDGQEKPELVQLAKELDITDSVWFPGMVDNPYKYMARSSVFVLSSKWEGFGNVITEALACGCPVVSTDCPTGPREILEDGKYGYLVPVGDDQALAKAVNSSLQEQTDRDRLLHRAQDFSLQNIVDQYEELF
jgi:glycosyltransferase involved in cell wall biosynthesis